MRALLLMPAILPLSACSVNPATGEKQFTALMSPSDELKAGAAEHKQVEAAYGIAAESDPLQSYLRAVGAKIAAGTERKDVHYKFFLLDTPAVNAFAVPGGYVYVTRGLMAQANSEAELAAVLAHEIGHITARHSAEQYSRGVVASMGTALLSSAVGGGAAAQALGLGSDLYMKSYSRAQETQADELGVRYAYRAGYSPYGMAWFLENLDAAAALDAQLSGGGDLFSLDYFSTHPKTADRVSHALEEAAKYPVNAEAVRHEDYLRHIDGLVYGDSAKQGFAKGGRFYHAGLDFTFAIPRGFRLSNEPAQIVLSGPGGGIVLIDSDAARPRQSAYDYMKDAWLKDEKKAAGGFQHSVAGGREAATVSFPGRIAGREATIMAYAVRWSGNRFFRFQIAVPEGTDAAPYIDIVASLRPLTAREKKSVKPPYVHAFTAQAGDTVEARAAHMPFADMRPARLRVLNGLKRGEEFRAGQLYKTIASD
jgi:predicted Zn-dependent protease